MLFSSFHFLRTGKKGQLASLLTVVLVALLIFIFISVDLGKFGLNRTRVSNAADSAALAAGSVASQLLNYMASYNGLMLMNFAGFVSQATLILICWIIDLVMTIKAVILVFTSSDNAAVIAAIEEAISCIICLSIDSMLLMLTIEGATKVGEQLKSKIYELNLKLPENTRNVLRQYAFMNAGIDEPKIGYNKWLTQTGNGDSDSSWKGYLNQETGFSSFMRTLSQTNDNDLDYSSNNLLSYSWQDERRGQVVDNVVEVYSTPVQQLSFDDIDFGDIANNSGLRSELISAINDEGLSWWLGAWVELAITLSPILLISFEIIRAVQVVLVVIMGIFAIICAILTILYIIWCCIWGGQASCAKIPFEVAATAFFVAYVIIALSVGIPDPADIPAVEYGSGSNDLTLSTEIRRKTVKAGGGAMDYGLWSMQYPEIEVHSKAEIIGSGGGKLFPPVTDYCPQLSFIK